MANVTMTIPLPVLTGSQYFKTRYRLLPSGAWSSYVNRTNAPFILTALADGDYQMEIVLVKEDMTECAATYTTFKVVTDYDCIDFDVQLVQADSLFNLNITYTLPGGFTDPACGWDIIITDQTGTKTIPYASLPVSGSITLAVSNIAMLVRIRANMCDGKYKYCHEEDVSPIAETCTPMVVTKSEIIKLSSGLYYLRVFIANSNPVTKNAVFNYKEISLWYPTNVSPDSGTYIYPAPPLLPGTYMYSIPVNPKAYPIEGLQYEGTITDICGKSHYWKTNIIYQ